MANLALIDRYLEIPDVPIKKQRYFTGKLVMELFGYSMLCLQTPPFASLLEIADAGDWDSNRRAELQIPLDCNVMVADFGPGTEEGLILDCTANDPVIRFLKIDSGAEAQPWCCPIIYRSLDEYADKVIRPLIQAAKLK